MKAIYNSVKQSQLTSDNFWLDPTMILWLTLKKSIWFLKHNQSNLRLIQLNLSHIMWLFCIKCRKWKFRCRLQPKKKETRRWTLAYCSHKPSRETVIIQRGKQWGLQEAWRHSEHLSVAKILGHLKYFLLYFFTNILILLYQCLWILHQFPEEMWMYMYG